MIILPPRVVAGGPATLAVLDAHGKLAPGVQVQIGASQGAETDSTGRAYFRVPDSGAALIVRGAGATAVALVDPPSKHAAPRAASEDHLSMEPVISLRDRFSICGGHFSGGADENRVTIAGERALVLAASPECIVALAAPNTPPGQATISIDSSAARAAATATLVSLEFHEPRLSPGAKGALLIAVIGDVKPLHLRVENGSPDVVRIARGDSQIVRTDGKPGNSARVEVQAIRSGDFSLSARLIPPPDPRAARQYLAAAEPLAAPDLRAEMAKVAGQIEHHPRDVQKAMQALQRISGSLREGDLRTLIDAARSAL